MKTFWGAVVTVVVAVSLTGCGEAAVAGPAGAHRTGVAVERTWTPAPAAPEVVPVPAVAAVVEHVEEQVTQQDAPPAPPALAVPPTAAPDAPSAPAVPPVATAPEDTRDYSMFPCADGYAPGWLDEQGQPTGCVAN
jgi:hypothetical protein